MYHSRCAAYDQKGAKYKAGLVKKTQKATLLPVNRTKIRLRIHLYKKKTPHLRPHAYYAVWLYCIIKQMEKVAT